MVNHSTVNAAYSTVNVLFSSSTTRNSRIRWLAGFQQRCQCHQLRAKPTIKRLDLTTKQWIPIANLNVIKITSKRTTKNSNTLFFHLQWYSDLRSPIRVCWESESKISFRAMIVDYFERDVNVLLILSQAPLFILILQSSPRFYVRHSARNDNNKIWLLWLELDATSFIRNINNDTRSEEAEENTYQWATASDIGSYQSKYVHCVRISPYAFHVGITCMNYQILLSTPVYRFDCSLSAGNNIIFDNPKTWSFTLYTVCYAGTSKTTCLWVNKTKWHIK